MSLRITRRYIQLLSIALMLLVSGCASTGVPRSSEIQEAPQVDTVDKFERFNRASFRFTQRVDRWLLKPVAKGYDAALPGFVKSGVGNFFGNLGEVRNVLNDSLQGKWKQAGNDSGRFLINSTVGLLGVFDVAQHVGLEKSDGEDFGQTLATWGVPQGPYLFIPILGPSSVRGATTLPVEWYTTPHSHIQSKNVRYGASGLDVVHARAGFLQTEELASGDLYLFVRDAYLQRRDYLINDGVVEDDFGGDFDDEDWGDEDF